MQNLPRRFIFFSQLIFILLCFNGLEGKSEASEILAEEGKGKTRCMRSTVNNYGLSAIRVPDPVKNLIKNSILRHVPLDAPIIDIGCGFGAISQFIRTLGYTNVHAIDLEGENIETYPNNKEEIHFIEGEFPNQEVLTKLPAMKWGGVVALNVFHFMEEDKWEKSLEVIYDNLKEKGYLVAVFQLEEAYTLIDTFMHEDNLKKYRFFKASKFKKKLEDIGYKIHQFEERPIEAIIIVSK